VSPLGWDVPADLEKDPALIPDPETTEVPAALREEIEVHMSHYPDRRSAALPALAAAQRLHGWCSPVAIEQVACVMRLTPAYLESVVSFYDMLETTPVGRHSVYVCTNISCSLRGADELYEAARAAAEDHPELNVRAFECLGACDIAPMASVDGVYVGPLSPADLPQLLADLEAGRPVLPDRQLTRRPVADPRANTREFPEHPVAPPPRIDAANLELPTEPTKTAIVVEDPGEQTGPPAPHEDPPDHAEEDDS
jgi:NADH:ubiquinone oxidoreductase subunit E